MIGAKVFAKDQTLEFHVKQFIPDAMDEDLELRVTLLKARDVAAALRGRTLSWLATECACHAHDIAGRFVFRPGETVPRLRMAADLCRALVKSAMAADSLNSEEAPL